MVAVVAAAVLAGSAIVSAIVDDDPMDNPDLSSSPTPGPSEPTPSPEPEEPPFRFTTARIEHILTRRAAPSARIRRVTHRAAHDVRHAITRLHRLAFLEEVNWRAGAFGEVFVAFDGSARAAARMRVGLLTLGPQAGRRIESVTDPAGTIKIRVLLNRHLRPFTAEATVRFRALAEQTGGGAMVVQSQGSYFLRPAEAGWLIYGFRVSRHDHPVGGG